MKRILVINHSTRPGEWDYESGATPVVSDDVAEWFVSRRHGKILEDIPEKKKVERAVKKPTERAVSTAEPKSKPKSKPKVKKKSKAKSG